MARRPSPDTLEPRKTARQMRATHTVEAIIEAAARIFEVEGFEGYTTNAIAQKAGVSIGSLYQYFPNKDAITLALIAREANLLEAEIMQASIIERWEEALDAMVLAAVRHQLRRPVLARVLDVEEARLPQTKRSMSGSDQIYACVLNVLNRAGKCHSDAATLTVDVIGLTRGMTDMAGRIGEVGLEELGRRVRLAVFGYLGRAGIFANGKNAPNSAYLCSSTNDRQKMTVAARQLAEKKASNTCHSVLRPTASP